MAGTAPKPNVRGLATLLLLVLGAWADLYGWLSAYATFATNDYGPILLRGGWNCGVAIVSFLAATAFYRSFLVRVLAVIGVASVLPALAEILRRLHY